jgi:hypothetical protein
MELWRVGVMEKQKQEKMFLLMRNCYDQALPQAIDQRDNGQIAKSRQWVSQRGCWQSLKIKKR